MKKEIKSIFLIGIIISSCYASFIYCLIDRNPLFSQPVKLENKRTINNNIEIADNSDPGAFVLSSDKNKISEGDTILLTWNISLGADNYSIYYSEGLISVIDSNAKRIKDNLTQLNYTVSYFEFETTYLVVVSYNGSGYTLSNNIKITFAFSEETDDEEKSESLTMISFFTSFFLLITIAIFIGIVCSFIIYRVRNKKPITPAPNFKRLPRGAISYVKKDNHINAEEDFEIKSAGKDFRKTIELSAELIKEFGSKIALIQNIEGRKDFKNLNNEEELELTALSDDFLFKVDKIPWENEEQKKEFIKEMLALTPRERDDILGYIDSNSIKNNKDKKSL